MAATWRLPCSRTPCPRPERSPTADLRSSHSWRVRERPKRPVLLHHRNQQPQHSGQDMVQILL
ncbi:MAG: hypothetical protein KME57_04040 [Scytonema hyalinum WJT4-NPBG1]|nr:hypothetical protein [Scytonema hyalinum WJT4-NPBG1]